MGGSGNGIGNREAENTSKKQENGGYLHWLKLGKNEKFC